MTPDGLRAALAQQTEEVFLELLTINHASLGSPIKLVNDRVDMYRSSISWEFDNTAAGWTGTNANITTSAGYATVTATAADPQFRSPSGLSIDGVDNTRLQVKIRRRSAGAWEGRVFYETGGHGFAGTHYKDIADPTVLDEWVVAEWDMADLTVGGTDWVDSVITRLRFDFSSADASIFDVAWIAVGDYAFVAFPFTVRLHTRSDDMDAMAEIVADNVDQRIIQALRALEYGATVRYEVALAGDPYGVEMGPFDFEVKGFSANLTTISLRVAFAMEFLNEAFPKDYFAPWNAG